MTSMSESVYIDKLVDIVNEYSNTYHSKIRMKPIDVNSDTYIDFNKEIDEKKRLVILLEYQNIKMLLQKETPNWCEKVLVIKKVKNTEILR